jgi:hypothetical protein
MENQCVLCDELVEAIGAIVIVGNVSQPEQGTMCRRCTALSAKQRKAKRDEAMRRALMRNDHVE